MFESDYAYVFTCSHTWRNWVLACLALHKKLSSPLRISSVMCSFLRIGSHLLKKFLMENLFFCAVLRCLLAFICIHYCKLCMRKRLTFLSLWVIIHLTFFKFSAQGSNIEFLKFKPNPCGCTKTTIHRKHRSPSKSRIQKLMPSSSTTVCLLKKL